jgi:pimeloyl-ACP methyl ester carboxylesterase
VTELEPPPPVSVPTVFAGGLKFHYRQAGSGPQVVLIHGLTGTLADWQLRVVPLLTSHFSVLTYDLRGHGYSDMPPRGYTSADMAADLANLMDVLGIDRAHVIGHSFGGTTALHFAALYPERVLALTVSDSRVRSLQPSHRLKDWPHWPLWREQLRKQDITLDEDRELDFSLLELLISLREARGHQVTAAADRRRDEQWGRLLSSTTANADLRDAAGLTPELISRIRLPTQAIYAEYSFFFPTLEGLKERVQSLRWAVVPGVGHLYPILRPELFAQYVKAFHATSALPAGDTPGAPRSEGGLSGSSFGPQTGDPAAKRPLE